MRRSFLHADQATDGSRLERHEVAEADLAAGEESEHCLVDDVEGLELEGFDAALAAGDHDIDVVRLEGLEQGGNRFGQVLTVGVHDDRTLAVAQLVGRPRQADGDGTLMSDVAAQTQHDAFDSGGDHGCGADRLLDGAVVDRDHEELLAEFLVQFLEQAAGGFDVFEDGSHDNDGTFSEAHRATTFAK